VESSFLTRDQALSLWHGSTDFKTLDYQRTNPREHQVELTQRKPLEYKTCHHPITSSTLCRRPSLNNKQNKNTNSITSRQNYHLIELCPSEKKKTKNSAQISRYTKLTQATGQTLGGQKRKGRENRYAKLKWVD